MDKDEYKYKKTLCECLHTREEHAGIDKYCYVSGCKCMEFKELKLDEGVVMKVAN